MRQPSEYSSNSVIYFISKRSTRGVRGDSKLCLSFAQYLNGLPKLIVKGDFFELLLVIGKRKRSLKQCVGAGSAKALFGSGRFFTPASILVIRLSNCRFEQ
mmetsp:Transcript_109267/g.151204  ORF Transcript_109267/g.151204 Transcript_109267/m.151204 type:complete len:101 (-) Transcript_109267:1190-1492(-)